jgi:hypothetical protein
MYTIITINRLVMICKKIIFSFLFLIQAFIVSAQNSTSSPYSGFGIGELEFSSGGRNTGMGQTGIALRSNLFLNTSNPASLTALDHQGFLLDMGLDFEYSQLKSSTKTIDVIDGNISWVQMAFPISKKLFGGISINPKSSVGYNIYTQKEIEGTNISFPSTYEGTGGLSEAAGMLAWKLTNNISIGAKAGYLWGSVTQTVEQTIPVATLEYTLNQVNNIRYSGGYFNFGTQIIIPVSSKSSMIFGGIAGLSSRLNSETTSTITKGYNGTSEILASNLVSTGVMKLPLDVGAGISFLYGNKWVTTFDYKQSNWEDATIAFSSSKLSTNRSYRGGLEFSPKNNPESLHHAARYRFGYRYETGYLKIYNSQIHEQAVSFGVGIPIRKGRSFANFTFELGTKGTQKTYLVQEKFVKLNCSFNLWDNWFVKRQID